MKDEDWKDFMRHYMARRIQYVARWRSAWKRLQLEKWKKDAFDVTVKRYHVTIDK